MRELFQSFECENVAYLLIGGQATVIYGAADFTQDVDIWIRPDLQNFDRLLRSLAACRARVHKLTPPLTLHWARRGHGFHFIVPTRESRVPLDVLARPPRVGSFARLKSALDWKTRTGAGFPWSPKKILFCGARGNRKVTGSTQKRRRGLGKRPCLCRSRTAGRPAPLGRRYARCGSRQRKVI